ncbi:type IV secretion system protein [Xenophilus azovorans]|uniref:type IV secretion system protein n=1 Tax=Xenophilus azovorans TaxID=151755 RepID=UPI0009FEA6C1|nr:type IV secretion system protein [Xenophilus azovorans]
MTGFYTSMFTKLNGTLDTYVSSTSASVIGAITPVTRTLLMIYVCLWGWSMMRGVIDEPVTDGIARMVRLSIIVAIATMGGYYSAFVADWLWQSPDAIASYIAADSSTTNVSFLDSLWDKFYNYGNAYIKKANADSNALGIPDLTPLLAGAGILTGGVICTGYAAFLFALAKMALAILLGVGPIFVLLLIFEPTKQFFNSWLGQTLNYIFLAMLTAAAVKLILQIISAYLNTKGVSANMPTEGLELGDAIAAIALSVIGFLVLMQMPSIASALGGGVAVSTLGAVGSLYGKAKGAAFGAAAFGWARFGGGKAKLARLQHRRNKQMLNTWAKRNPEAARSPVSRGARAAAGAPQAVYRRITTRRSNSVQQA